MPKLHKSVSNLLRRQLVLSLAIKQRVRASAFFFLTVLVACGRTQTLNGGYTASFDWNQGVCDFRINRTHGNVMTPRAQRIIQRELERSVRDTVAKANLHDAKGSLAFTVSGEPPYVVLLHGVEIKEPPISDLMLAVERQDIPTIVSLISRYQNVNQKELPSERSALHNACAGGKLKSVNQLLHLGADPNASDFEGDTPLIVSVAANSIPVARSLIAAGAQINRADYVGDTPLIRAVQLDRTDMIRLLLQSGADSTFKAQDGKTALMIAEEHHSQAAVGLLKMKR